MKKMIPVLSVLALLALLLGSANPAKAQGVAVSINAPTTVDGDSDFTATVDITEVVDFDAGQFDVSFDDSVLRLDDVTAGLIGTTEIPVSIKNEISPGTYRIIVNVPGVPGVSGSGYLAVLHFHVIGSGGSSAIDLPEVYINNNLADEIATTWTGGSVTVYEQLVITTTSLPDGVPGIAYLAILEATGVSGSYTWSISSGSLPDGLNLSSAGVISGTPTALGPFSFTVEVTDGQLSDSKAYSITVVISGDANGDGEINIADIITVERIIVELQAATSGADANQDGRINTADVTKIERIAVGLD